MARKKTISFGIPCFNEELNIALVYKELQKVTRKNPKYTYEYIFVDNGSTDKTREEISKLALKHTDVIGIFLSKNFGPEASTQTAIDITRADAIIIYECDMQDPPELIPQFIKKWEEGNNIVVGVREKTEDTFLMSTARKTFYRIIKMVSNVNIPVDAGHFSLLDKKAITALQKLSEKYRFYRGLRAWIGYKTAYITYQRRERMFGKSSYNIFAYFNYAIRSFFGFSYLPLDLTIYVGFFLIFLSFLFICIYLAKLVIYGIPLTSEISIIFLITFFGGAHLLAISMIGKYIQVLVEETKNRPVYIIDETVNLKKNK